MSGGVGWDGRDSLRVFGRGCAAGGSEGLQLVHAFAGIGYVHMEEDKCIWIYSSCTRLLRFFYKIGNDTGTTGAEQCACILLHMHVCIHACGGGCMQQGDRAVRAALAGNAECLLSAAKGGVPMDGYTELELEPTNSNSNPRTCTRAGVL